MTASIVVSLVFATDGVPINDIHPGFTPVSLQAMNAFDYDKHHDKF